MPPLACRAFNRTRGLIGYRHDFGPKEAPLRLSTGVERILGIAILQDNATQYTDLVDKLRVVFAFNQKM